MSQIRETPGWATGGTSTKPIEDESTLAVEARVMRDLGATVLDATDIGTHAIEYGVCVRFVGDRF